MDALVALALSIGILIAGWTYVALGRIDLSCAPISRRRCISS